MITKFKNLLILAAIVVVGVIVYVSFKSTKSSIEVGKGQIRNIETMVQLCSIDLYNEVPVLDTINNKVLFAIQKQRGSVSFDLENMEIDDKGDTVKITLPPEIIVINEATDDNSWEVIDTKNLNLFGSSRLNDNEENIIKSKIRNNSKKLLYQNGTIKRARSEAAANLQSLMEKIYRKPVAINDPTPEGAHKDDFK